MTDGIIQIPRELFEKMLQQCINTQNYSFGSNIRVREIKLELGRLGLWFKE